MSEITYRPAKAKDAVEITKYLDIASEGFFNDFFTGMIPNISYEELMSGWIADDTDHYSYPSVTVAEIESNIVGHIMCFDSKYFCSTSELEEFYPAEHFECLSQYYNVGLPEKSLYIESLAVDSTLRSKGIGKTLMDSVIKRASEESYEKICLFVFEENVQGQKFYAREGFKLAKKFPLKHFQFLEPNSNRSGSRLLVRDV